jgi:apolipoprotein N-acyltransferase
MNTLAQLGLLVGFTWGIAGVLAFPGVSWKPGTILAVVSLVWIVAHEPKPPLDAVEGLALLIFFALSVIRDRMARAEKAKEK